MNESTLPSVQTQMPAQQVDWAYQQEFRTQLFLQCPELDLPKYLLKTEIIALSNCAQNEHQRMLLLTLFNTGARINELLAVTPNDIFTVGQRTLIKVKTLKQQKRGRQGRPKAGEIRVVPLFDGNFARELNRYIVTHCTNRKHPIFYSSRDKAKAISDETARNWLSRIEKQYLEAGYSPLLITLSPKVLRHAFAMHLIFHGCHIKRVQSLLGHSKLSSTEIYTKMASFDIGDHLTIDFS